MKAKRIRYNAEIKAIAEKGNKVKAECKKIILEARALVFKRLSLLKGDNEARGRSLAKEKSSDE